jgi:hypothetical protein
VTTGGSEGSYFAKKQPQREGDTESAMRAFVRVFLWLVAALFCAISAVVFSYISTFIGAIVFRFGIESQTAISYWQGSLFFFGVTSCAFLGYIATKMVKGDL